MVPPVSFERLIQFNAQQAREAATTIVASRRPWGFLPELIGAFFALAAAGFGARLLTQYLAWARERSGELEQFAGRVGPRPARATSSAAWWRT